MSRGHLPVTQTQGSFFNILFPASVVNISGMGEFFIVRKATFQTHFEATRMLNRTWNRAVTTDRGNFPHRINAGWQLPTTKSQCGFHVKFPSPYLGFRHCWNDFMFSIPSCYLFIHTCHLLLIADTDCLSCECEMRDGSNTTYTVPLDQARDTQFIYLIETTGFSESSWRRTEQLDRAFRYRETHSKKCKRMTQLTYRPNIFPIPIEPLTPGRNVSLW